MKGRSTNTTKKNITVKKYEDTTLEEKMNIMKIEFSNLMQNKKIISLESVTKEYIKNYIAQRIAV